jgi:site-specific DNA-adenine methylase
MSLISSFFQKSDAIRRKRLEAIQQQITSKLSQVKSKADVTVDTVKDYFTSGQVKEDIKKQYSLENIKRVFDPFSMLKTAARTYFYDPETKKALPQSLLRKENRPDMTKLANWKNLSEQEREQELQKTIVPMFMLSGAPQGVVNPGSRAYKKLTDEGWIRQKLGKEWAWVKPKGGFQGSALPNQPAIEAPTPLITPPAPVTPPTPTLGAGPQFIAATLAVPPVPLKPVVPPVAPTPIGPQPIIQEQKITTPLATEATKYKSTEVWYHGTSQKNAKSILKEGWNPTKSDTPNESPYALFASKETGDVNDHSAGLYNRGAMLEIRPKPNANIKGEDYWYQTFGKSHGAEESAQIAKNAIAEGVDIVKDPSGEVYILNPKSVDIKMVTKATQAKGVTPQLAGKPAIPPTETHPLINESFVRLADEANKNTDALRGGTWFTNKGGIGSLQYAIKEKIIGGGTLFKGNLNPKNPLVVKEAQLEDGSLNVINLGYENYIKPKYYKILDHMMATILYPESGAELPDDQIDIHLMNALEAADIPETQAIKVLNVTPKNKLDVTADMIMTKALKEEGYDALILLTEGGQKHVLNFDTSKAFEPAPPKLTIAKLEKQELGEHFKDFISQAKTGESYTSRVNKLSEVADKPEISNDRVMLRQLRTLVRKEILKLTGLDAGGTGHWKQDFAYLQMIKADPAVADQVTALEELIYKLDEKIGVNVQAKIADFSEDLGLPTTADYYIPVRKYSTRGTGNREWIQQNIPLVYMGNKRGMVGYILDVLGIKRDDLQFLNSQDTAHLPFTQVYDLFGGSGLLANLSTKLFPKAQITYNEYDPQVVKAIETVKTNPRPVTRFIKEVGIWLQDHPGADWLAHFQLVHKSDPMFRTAAKLIEATAGRTGEVTAQKIANMVKAVPNYAKAFKDVQTTNEDAFAIMDRLIANPPSKGSTLVYIDPPYWGSAGYAQGAEMMRSSGFMKVLDYIGKLDKVGVKVIAFNNDPEVQAPKAGLEEIHLNNIMGKINQLSEQGVTVIRGIKPIGAPDRREIMLTNLDYGKKTNRLLNQKWVMEAIEKLHAQPAAEMSKSFLSLLRSIRGSSEFAPGTQRISPNQIRMIRTLKNRLRIKNREMLPILDELLGDTSFAKMTKEDGEKMIAWLQPQNYRIIEKQVDLTKDRLGKARLQAVIGEPSVAVNEELEKKFNLIDVMNRTAGDIENITKMVGNLPKMEAPKWNNLRRALLLPAKALSEDLATKILGIKGSFHTPLRAIINISTKFKNRMHLNLSQLAKDLSEEERKAVAFIQGGAEKEFKGTISPKARQTANYLQEVFRANLAIVNRLRQAVNQPIVPERNPYISYILNQDILEAAHLGDRVKFWEQRVKTPKDFAAGLFTQDLNRIFKIWSESSANWLKKNLYQALLADKFEEIYKVSDAASMYARTIMEMDIYNMMGDFERSFRVIGQAINDSVGKIYPKRIPVNEELAKSLLNTTFGQELIDSIKHGYLYVPRFQLPNVGEVFHKVFYPAKLAWNFGFAVLNRQQPWAATPFVGVINKLKGRLKLYGVMMPWNGKARDRYISMLESSGYQFGRMMYGEQFPTAKSTLGVFVDRSINFLNDVTELANRMENAIDAEYVLANLEKKAGMTLERRDKEKIAGQFSAFINFISGKSYSPVAQRNAIGRVLYTFQQYPIYQLNVFHEMLKYAHQDKGAADFWKLMNDEGGASEKAYEAFQKLPDKSKSRYFAILLAIAIPVATIYSMSRSWSVAARALPGMPRVAMNNILKALFAWVDDPSDDNRDVLATEIKGFFRVTVTQRVNDAFDVMKTGILQTTTTGRPLFVQKTIDNAVRMFVFGRSILPEYEKRYPSILSKIFGGQTEAGQVKKLQKSRLKQQQTDTENAVEFMKRLETSKTIEEKKALLKEFAEAGKFNTQMKDKLKQYLTEKTTGTGGLERSIIGLNDADQAQFVLDNLNKAKTVEAKQALLADYAQRGVLTANVIAEMKKLLLNKK